MAILNNNPLIGSGGQQGYNINNSLRFRSSASAYLSRTPASAGNRTTWTWSAWVKRGASDGANAQMLFGVNTGAGTYSEIRTLGDKFCFQDNNFATEFSTNAVLRDFSAWYHLMLVLDTTQATSTNRVKAYINGVEQTFAAGSYPTQNNTLSMNTANAHNIGRRPTGVSYFDGYLAEVNFIDGSAKTPSDFGETDTTTGVWKPKAYSGTYGTNGFYLKFSDIATTSGSNAGLGKDFSGNSNYWTTNNISVTAGTTYDAMTDSPTLTSATVANYAVMNRLVYDTLAQNIVNGNLQATLGDASNGRLNWLTIPMRTGKWYVEFTTPTFNGSTQTVGIISEANTLTNRNVGNTYIGSIAGEWSYGRTSSTVRYSNGSLASTGTTVPANNDIISLSFDGDAGTLEVRLNNVLQSITGFTGIPSGTYFFGCAAAGAPWIVNAGQRPFSYTPPTGFVALNTYNLPTPTILQGNKYMDATLWTGDNANPKAITNAAGFQPDLVWVKSRSNAQQHVLNDSVRGAGTSKGLSSNTTDAEGSANILLYGAVTAFNSNGFSVGGGTSNQAFVNYSPYTYVGWQWQAGQGSTSSNTSGSITSTVSVNTTAGFSIATFTSQASGTGTVGHGLGIAPSMMILKPNTTANAWIVWHSAFPASQYLQLQATSAVATGTTYFNSTAPTSSVITLGTAYAASIPVVAYVFAEIAGFSKFTSYTGNGSADGPFVYCGFRPKYVMYKDTANGSTNWEVVDSARNTSNPEFTRLFPNQSNADDTAVNPVMDFTANGFKIRTSAFGANNNGNTHIVMAFAENPFKNSLAR